jgi:hypothetical protein
MSRFNITRLEDRIAPSKFGCDTSGSGSGKKSHKKSGSGKKSGGKKSGGKKCK